MIDMHHHNLAYLKIVSSARCSVLDPPVSQIFTFPMKPGTDGPGARMGSIVMKPK